MRKECTHSDTIWNDFALHQGWSSSCWMASSMHRTTANRPVLFRTTILLFVMLTASAVQAQSHYRPGYMRHNLAEAKPVTVSEHPIRDGASSAVDADATSIWEADLSETNSWLQVD